MAFFCCEGNCQDDLSVEQQQKNPNPQPKKPSSVIAMQVLHLPMLLSSKASNTV